jgi:hypothetical protein
MTKRPEEGRAVRTAVTVALSLAVGVGLGVAGTWYWLHAPASPARSASTLPPPPPLVMPTDAPPADPSPIVAASTEPSVAISPGPPPDTTPPTLRTARAAVPPAQSTRPLTQSVPTPPAAPIAPPNPDPGRRFVQGATSVESLRPVGTELRGFDTTGVGVKRAPAVNGRLELEMNPERVLPGQPYVVSVFLANDGKKPIELGGMRAATLVDGKWVQVPLTADTKVVAPGRRALLRELPGTWKNNVGSWSVEVEVTSKRHDVYRNRLSWK